MKRILEKAWLKTVAFLLCCVLLACAVACGAGAAYAMEENWYQEEVPFEDSDLCYWLVLSYLQKAYYGGLDPDYSGCYSYVVLDQEGHILEDTRQEGSRRVVNGATMSSYGPDGTHRETVIMDGYINLPLEPGDDAWVPYRCYTVLQSMTDWFIPVGAACLVLTLALFVFLLAAAGRQEGGTIRLRGLNRWPLDLYAGVTALLLLFIAEISVNYTGYEFYEVAAVATLGALPAAALCLGLCVTLAARIRAGGWWRNTLVFRICRILARLAGGFFRALPLVWKMAVAYAGMVFLNILLWSMAILGSGLLPLLLLFLLDLAGLYGVMRLGMQLRSLQKAGQALAGGDLTYCVDTKKLWLDLRGHGENLNSVGLGMAKAVNERMRSERFKTELITNVSHDLKTPLTSIVSYVDLLGKEELENPQAREYVQVLERQSARLKKLTEDLVEASKVSAGVVTANLERLDLAELLRQSAGEYAQRFAAAELEPVLTLPEKECPAQTDGRLLWRVLDNLLSNITKYSQPHTRVYMDLTEGEEGPVLTLKNISRQSLNIPVEELMERFVRGDAARSTEGSGLGLSIAQSLMECMGGKLELALDGDLFKAILNFPR